jgi:hypothetical protein
MSLLMRADCTLNKHLWIHVVELDRCLIPCCLVHVIRVSSQEAIILLLGKHSCSWHDLLLRVIGIFKLGRETFIRVMVILMILVLLQIFPTPYNSLIESDVYLFNRTLVIEIGLMPHSCRG